MNPLGILVAQLLGVARDPALASLLLAIGACVPFQIFLNEAVAVRMASGRAPSARRLVILVLASQAFASFVSLHLLTATTTTDNMVWPTVFATLVTSVLSFAYSKAYFRLVVHGGMTVQQAAVFGALPGLATIAIYVFASLLQSRSAMAFQAVLLLSVVLPTLAGYVYVQHLVAARGVQPDAVADAATLPTMASSAAVLVGLMVLTFSATQLRGEIASTSDQFAAMIVFGLNAVASIMMTLTRAVFLSPSRRNMPAILPGLALTAGLLAWLVTGNWPLLAALCWLLATQAIVIALIEFGRRCGSSAAMQGSATAASQR